MSCNAYVESVLNESADLNCSHTNRYYYCSAGEIGHEGKHQALVTLDATSDKPPFLYTLDALVEWE